jgi:molybdopterin-containing oxidoreductase family membrane subunit
VLIATYVFFVACTSGLCLVGALGHVFHYKLFEPLAKRALLLGLITLVVGFAVIGSELERPILLMEMVFVSPNPSSPIWWMGTLYGIYLVIIALELFFLIKEDHRRARIAGIIGLVAAVAAHANLGAVFALNHSRPFWSGPFFPVFFVAWALLCGAALLILMVYATDYLTNEGQIRDESRPLLIALGKLLVLFVSIVALLTVWKFIADMYGGHGGEAAIAWARLTGPLFFSFWFFEIFLGILAPMALLLGPRRENPRTIAMAALLPMLASFVMRYNFVVAGQMLSLKPVAGHLGEIIQYGPPFKGSPAGFLSYTPSIVEVLIVVGALAAAIVFFVAGLRLLEPKRKEVANG